MVKPAGKIRSQSDGVSKTEGERYPMRTFQPDTDGSSLKCFFYRSGVGMGSFFAAQGPNLLRPGKRGNLAPFPPRSELTGLTLADGSVKIKR